MSSHSSSVEAFIIVINVSRQTNAMMYSEIQGEMNEF